MLYMKDLVAINNKLGLNLDLMKELRDTSYSVPKVRDVNGTLVPTEAIQNLTVGYLKLEM